MEETLSGEEVGCPPRYYRLLLFLRQKQMNPLSYCITYANAVFLAILIQLLFRLGINPDANSLVARVI